MFHSLLLLVPSTVSRPLRPATRARLSSSGLHLSWQQCQDHQDSPQNCSLQTPDKMQLVLSNCTLTCPSQLPSSLPVEVQVCSLLGGSSCHPNPVRRLLIFKGLNISSVTGPSDSCRSTTLTLATKADPCVSGANPFTPMKLEDDCSAVCDAVTNLVGQCGWYDNGNRGLTNSLYFLLRTVATMALACCFIMLDAQTIQMCKVRAAASSRAESDIRWRRLLGGKVHMASRLSSRLWLRCTSAFWPVLESSSGVHLAPGGPHDGPDHHDDGLHQLPCPLHDRYGAPCR